MRTSVRRDPYRLMEAALSGKLLVALFGPIRPALGLIRNEDGSVAHPHLLRFETVRRELGEDLRSEQARNVADRLGLLVSELEGHDPRVQVVVDNDANAWFAPEPGHPWSAGDEFDWRNRSVEALAERIFSRIQN